MNHTIKGILIAAAIASMLVVGATTMVPIMQNSLAHKKSDFKGADPNTNTNTNSANSSSTSSATADNTNNITNSATASSNQNQNACAVALTCPQGTTTVTLAPPTPPTSTCKPDNVDGFTATPTDGTCTANSDGLSGTQLDEFAKECEGIPGTPTRNEDGSFTCTFPSTPPT